MTLPRPTSDPASGAPSACTVLLEVREVPIRPPGCRELERKEFGRTLELLREEFGTRLVLDYQKVSELELNFFPLVRVQREELPAYGFPSWQVLRLVIGRHLAVEELAQGLIEEAKHELIAAGHRDHSWQDGLLLLGSEG